MEKLVFTRKHHFNSIQLRKVAFLDPFLCGDSPLWGDARQPLCLTLPRFICAAKLSNWASARPLNRIPALSHPVSTKLPSSQAALPHSPLPALIFKPGPSEAPPPLPSPHFVMCWAKLRLRPGCSAPNVRITRNLHQHFTVRPLAPSPPWTWGCGSTAGRRGRRQADSRGLLRRGGGFFQSVQHRWLCQRELGFEGIFVYVLIVKLVHFIYIVFYTYYSVELWIHWKCTIFFYLTD